MQEHPDAWTRVDAILEQSQNAQTRFFALQILEAVVRTRWGALPDAQREGVKTYVSNLIIRLATDEAAFRAQRTLVAKLNLVLVDVLKQDWPHRWPTFVPDLVGAARASEPLCENALAILRLLSEEVFDFAKADLTQAKARELKAAFNAQYGPVHELLLAVLTGGRRADLVRAALQTLNAFLSWVPLGYILEGPLVEALLRLLPQPAYRNLALQVRALRAACRAAGAAALNLLFICIHLFTFIHIALAHPPPAGARRGRRARGRPRARRRLCRALRGRAARARAAPPRGRRPPGRLRGGRRRGPGVRPEPGALPDRVLPRARGRARGRGRGGARGAARRPRPPRRDLVSPLVVLFVCLLLRRAFLVVA